MKILVAGLKGGLGKTTSAVNIAVQLAAEGETALIDGDPVSQTAYDHHTVAYTQHGERLPFAVIPWATLDLPEKVASLAGQYAHIVIDIGSGSEALLKAACKAVGTPEPGELLIPVRPNLGELRRIPGTITAAIEAQALSGAVVYPRVLLVDVPTHHLVEDEAVAREFLAANNIPTMAAHVRHSRLYPRQFGRAFTDVGDYAAVYAELRAEVEVAA